MQTLIIDDTIREELRSLAKYAENNEYSLDELLDIMNGRLEPPGADPNFTREIPIGYKVVYTIENQPKSRIRHMSISVDGENKLPNPTIVQEIISLLGFQNKLADCYVHDKEKGCINVIELMQ